MTREWGSILSGIRKELQGAVQNGRFRQKEAEQGSYFSEQWIVSGKVTFFEEGLGVCQTDYFTSASQIFSD